MRINYNTQAMNANDALTKSDNLVSKSIARLSSGLKVAAAKDNPSGYAMSKRMNMQIEGLSTATQSANDGISIIETVDGAMSEIHDILQRINELTVKAANGTLTDEDRGTIQSEVDQLKQEITRIAKTTEFNGQPLMDGTFDLKGYTDNTAVKVSSYSDNVTVQHYIIKAMDLQLDAEGNIDAQKSTVYLSDDSFKDITSKNVTYQDDNKVIITGDNDFELILNVNVKDYMKNPGAVDIDVTGIGAMTLQIGANEGQTLGVRIPTMSLDHMGIAKIDVSTEKGASDALQRMSDAIKYVSSARSRLGSYQNRLEHTVTSLGVTGENLTKAYSGIVDVDMAEETTEYTTQQVISQAATSILAQANERPSQVLQLLQ